MRNALSMPVLLLLLVSGRAWAEAPVYIPDPGLKAAIEDELQVSDPTPTDMLGLISLEAQSLKIVDLTGLEYASNLQTVRLRFNHIKYVDPLSGLDNLDSLSLNDNNIGDISPLGGLVNLTLLDLHNNEISDISALSGLVKVWSLALRENPLSDLSPLASMPCVAYLSLMKTRVSDISPLANMTTLRYLDLRDCPLNDEAYDIYLPQIRANNPGAVIDLDPHRGRMLTVSSKFGGSVVEPGEGEFLYPFDSYIHLWAEADPGFVFDRWTGSFLVTANPTDISMERDWEFQAHFLSLRDTLYVDDDAASDPNQDGSPEHPIARIQDAIEVANDGVAIFVAPGVYRENIKIGKKLRITAIDPCRPNGGPSATIEGTGGDPVVWIGSKAGWTCSLSGFVITRGRGTTAGALYCFGASPTLSHCLIVGNRCTDPNGAAVYFEQSRAVMANCTVADNYAGRNGAGLTLVDSNVNVVDSIFWGNYPCEICARGTSDPSIRYCNVRGWWPDLGNTRSDPLLARPGYWADPTDPNIVVAGENPDATWIDGDYHLKSQAGRWDPAAGSWRPDEVTSPAIDGGDRASPIMYEPVPNGGIINMGAYGGTTEASLSR
ncbi:MAG: leucine-rich repeat domain-containing protein [Sedimentisphaerales bacterium]|nr:leucine-rich repeat domain-containing protein [Sedimentisphaerales bacterium]